MIRIGLKPIVSITGTIEIDEQDALTLLGLMAFCHHLKPIDDFRARAVGHPDPIVSLFEGTRPLRSEEMLIQQQLMERLEAFLDNVGRLREAIDHLPSDVAAARTA